MFLVIPGQPVFSLGFFTSIQLMHKLFRENFVNLAVPTQESCGYVGELWIETKKVNTDHG